MKILINRKPKLDQPWGGGNLFVTAFCKYAEDRGHTITHKIEDDIDVAFMQDPRYDELGISANEIVAFKLRKPSLKVIHRVNECDARKGTNDIDHLLRECSKFTDKTIFVSNWIKDYHVRAGWSCNTCTVVYNGVNRGHFFRRMDRQEDQRTKIVAHHWSNNPMKGFDVYDAIDEFVGKNDNFTFTYIGRDRGTFKNAIVIPPKFGKDLGHALANNDVYISGTRFDPGPNHILEALACELPTYVYTDGGGAVEFAGESHTFQSVEELIGTLLNKQFVPNKHVPYTWDDCMDRIFEEIIT